MLADASPEIGAPCPRCANDVARGARFCQACGLPLGEPAEERVLRKTVTAVFCDVVGSTRLGEGLDPEALRDLMGRYFHEMRTVLEQHGGTVEKFIGDAVMAVFGVPEAHEDDALRACRAAVDMLAALARLNEVLLTTFGVQIAVRIGVNTGETVSGDLRRGSSYASGDSVNVAARLEQAARPGEILIGGNTHALVRHAVRAEESEPLMLAGKSEPLTAWRLLGVDPEAPTIERRLDTPLVGRQTELATLRAAFADAVAEPGLRLVTIVGEPGIGKSRLLFELVAELADQARVLRCHCPPYGQGITYLPLAELVHDLTDGRPEQLRALVASEPQADLIADVIAGAIGLSERDGLVDETQWAVLRLVEALARVEPVVLCLEDLHWAEPAFLQLVEYVAGCCSDVPVLIVGVGRTELLEDRPDWAHPRPNAQIVVLQTLSRQESLTLIGQEHGDRSLTPALRARLAEAAGGNPLFVQQLLALRVQDAAVGAELAVPPTLQALLAARIDHLPRDDRAASECASIEGRTFHRGAVTELLAPGARDEVGARLLSLTRRDFIRAHRSSFPGDDGFRFTHALVRDAVYAAMPKELRAQLHEHYARWLDDRLSSRSADAREIVGYHLEQAFHYREERGPVDDQARILAREAASLLAEGGDAARLRGDMAAATNLLARAADLLPADDHERVRLLPDLAVAYLEGGQPSAAAGVLDDAVQSARRIGDAQLERLALVQTIGLAYQVDPAFDWEDGLARALSLAELLEDEQALASAWGLVGVLRMRLGRMDAAEEALGRAAAHAGRAGDRFLESRMQLYTLSAKTTGSAPVPEALCFGELLLARAEEMPRNGLYARIWVARLLAMQGKFDEARALFAEAAARAEALGHQWLLGWQPLIEGWVELLAGDPRTAEEKLRASDRRASSIGAGYRAGLHARLAEALYRQDRLDEAGVALDEAALIDSSDPYARAHRDEVRAKLLARRGEMDEAERLALAAVAVLEATDDPDGLGDALMTLADVLGQAGRPDDALPIVERALARYDLKQNDVSAGHARTVIEALEKGGTHERAT